MKGIKKKKFPFTVYRLGDVWESVCPRQVRRAANTDRYWHQVLVLHSVRISTGHVSLFWQLWGDWESRRGRLMDAPLARGSAQLIRRTVSTRCHAAPHQRARWHTGSCCFRVSANQRTWRNTRWRWVPAQQGAGLTQASLQCRARRSVGGHCAVEGVRAAGDCVDAHNVDLRSVWGSRSVGVNRGGAVWDGIWRTSSSSTIIKVRKGMLLYFCTWSLHRTLNVIRMLKLTWCWHFSTYSSS